MAPKLLLALFWCHTSSAGVAGLVWATVGCLGLDVESLPFNITMSLLVWVGCWLPYVASGFYYHNVSVWLVLATVGCLGFQALFDAAMSSSLAWAVPPGAFWDPTPKVQPKKVCTPIIINR